MQDVEMALLLCISININMSTSNPTHLNIITCTHTIQYWSRIITHAHSEFEAAIIKGFVGLRWSNPEKSASMNMMKSKYLYFNRSALIMRIQWKCMRYSLGTHIIRKMTKIQPSIVITHFRYQCDAMRNIPLWATRKPHLQFYCPR